MNKKTTVTLERQKHSDAYKIVQIKNAIVVTVHQSKCGVGSVITEKMAIALNNQRNLDVVVKEGK